MVFIPFAENLELLKPMNYCRIFSRSFSIQEIAKRAEEMKEMKDCWREILD